MILVNKNQNNSSLRGIRLFYGSRADQNIRTRIRNPGQIHIVDIASPFVGPAQTMASLSGIKKKDSSVEEKRVKNVALKSIHHPPYSIVRLC